MLCELEPQDDFKRRTHSNVTLKEYTLKRVSMNEITKEKMGSIGGRKTSKKLLMCVLLINGARDIIRCNGVCVTTVT